MFLLLDTIYFSSDPPDSELFFLPPSSFFGAFANLRRERRKGKKKQKTDDCQYKMDCASITKRWIFSDTARGWGQAEERYNASTSTGWGWIRSYCIAPCASIDTAAFRTACIFTYCASGTYLGGMACVCHDSHNIESKRQHANRATSTLSLNPSVTSWCGNMVLLLSARQYNSRDSVPKLEMTGYSF